MSTSQLSPMGSSVNVTEKFTPTSQGPHPEVVPESGGLELDRSSHAPEPKGIGAWQEENALYKPYPQNHLVKRTVLGLKPLTFWLLVLLLTVLLAAGIGVGLGIGLSRSHKTGNPLVRPNHFNRFIWLIYPPDLLPQLQHLSHPLQSYQPPTA